MWLSIGVGHGRLIFCIFMVALHGLAGLGIETKGNRFYIYDFIIK